MLLILVLAFDKYAVLELINKYGFKFKMWAYEVQSFLLQKAKKSRVHCPADFNSVFVNLKPS